MGDYSKYKNVNTVFGGTGGIVVPKGTTAERDTGPGTGQIRYNTDLGLLEQYNDLGWQSVDAPPTITNISGIINENTNSTLTVTGSNFKTCATLYVTGAAVGGIERAMVTSFVSSSSLTFTTNATAVNFVGGASFGIKVVNSSGLSGVLDPAGNIDRDPVWSTASGTYTVYDSTRSTGLTFSASDPDGGTVTYSLASGTLPSGATLNSSTGVISGFSAVASDTSSNITLRATSSVGSQTADRSFTILVKAPSITSFTSTGASTFSVPTGVTSVQVLVVGAGGGSAGIGGGAGGGGVVYHASYPVTPGGSVPLTVGTGGSPGGNYPGPSGSNGGSSTFGVLTALGGAGAASWNTAIPNTGGGCGAGASSHGYPGTNNGSTASQPSQSNPGASYNAGYPGAKGGSDGTSNSTTGAGQYSGGGGGGAGQAGGHPSQTGPGDTSTNNSAGRKGGDGYQSSISGSATYYGGGGGGSNHQSGYTTPVSYAQGGQGGGGRGGSPDYAHPAYPGGGEPGTTNRGGGGGGGFYSGSGTAGGGAGGPGIVIVRY